MGQVTPRLKTGACSYPRKGETIGCLTGQPTLQGHAQGSKRRNVFVANIHGSVEICIEAVPALAAKEEGLRTAIGAMLIPTPTTRLAGMSGVNLGHSNPPCLCLVGQKAMELGKRPTMEAAFGLDVFVRLSASDLGSFADILQVLKHNGTAWGRILNDAFTQHMVMVSSLPKPLTRKFLQVPFGRFRAPFLQRAAQ